MIQMNIIPERKCALIMYPRAFKLPNKQIIVYSIADAKGKWESETKKFIHNLLRQWVLSRYYSYAATNKLFDSRKLAIDKLLLMFSFNQNVPLHLLCKRVIQDGAFFVRLFPNNSSRNFIYLKEVIIPVLQWCDEYQKDYENYLNNLIKYN